MSHYTLQIDLNIDVQVISSDEMVCKGNYFPPRTINFQYYYYLTNAKNNNIVSLKEIINRNVNVRCYNYIDAVSSHSRTIEQNYFRSLTPKHAPTKEHDNIMDKKNQR